MSARSLEAGEYWVRSTAFPDSKPRIAAWVRTSKGDMAWTVLGLGISFLPEHFVPVSGRIHPPSVPDICHPPDPVVSAVRTTLAGVCSDGNADSLGVAIAVIGSILGAGFQILPAGEVVCE